MIVAGDRQVTASAKTWAEAVEVARLLVGKYGDGESPMYLNIDGRRTDETFPLDLPPAIDTHD